MKAHNSPSNNLRVAQRIPAEFTGRKKKIPSFALVGGVDRRGTEDKMAEGG